MVDNAIFVSSTLSSNQVRLLFLFYTDPGAGALLWQLAVASLVGGAFYGRLLIRRAKARIAGLRRSGSAYSVALTERHNSEAIK